MEIILREDVEHLGARGQLVKVTAGYARNFLLPKKLGVPATDSNRKIVEQERHAHLRKDAKLKSEAEDLAKLLGTVTVSIVRKAGESDQLFGSVTAGDVADALALQKYVIERRKIQMDEPIKTLGEHKVTVRTHKEVSVEITVNVTREE
jgi:large subunit ribosomal protein L9